MERLSQIHKLDLVLTILANSAMGVNMQELKEKLNQTNDNLYRNEYLLDIYLILEKLINDGYAKEIKREVISFNDGSKIGEETKYYSTYNGKIFEYNNGYIGQINTNKEIENRKGRHQNNLLFATWFAGIAAFLLFLMEVVKFFCRK
jgi:hypothetical protein